MWCRGEPGASARSRTATRSRSSPSSAGDRRAMNDPLIIAGKPYRSRLIVGTGKYRDHAETRAALEASGAEIVTVALRRVELVPGQPSLLHPIHKNYPLLPNPPASHTLE